VKFRFDPKDASLKVSANSDEKSGNGYQWVNGDVHLGLPNTCALWPNSETAFWTKSIKEANLGGRPY